MPLSGICSPTPARFTVVILSYKAWSSNSTLELTTGTLVGIGGSIIGCSCGKGPDMVSGTAMSDRKARDIVALQGLSKLVVTFE